MDPVVLAGAGVGQFIGDYVYGKRHNHKWDHRQPVARRVLDHVHIGAVIE